VLLAADRDRLRLADHVAALLEGRAQGVPPLAGVALPAVAAGDRVPGLSARHDAPGGDVDDQRLGGLGGRIHTDDVRTLGG
jgi:hypothetical protein